MLFQPQILHMVERTALECGEYAHCRKWNPAIFTAPEHEFGGETSLPDALVILHTKEGSQYEEHEAIQTAAKVGFFSFATLMLHLTD